VDGGKKCLRRDVKQIVVTGAGGQIAYQLLFRIASGELFGKEPIALHLLELKEMMPVLEGVRMELEDSAFTNLMEIHIGSSPFEMFQGATHVFLVGAKPRGPGMERKELLEENGRIFIEQGKALNQVADPHVKVLVLGNPCNTNCWIALQNAPDLPKRNFHAMTRLDQNRAIFQLAKKAAVPLIDVQHVTIFGNHSSTQVPDFLNATIKQRPLLETIQDRNWLEKDFIEKVQKRGAEIIAARGKSSAASAASAALDAMKDICTPTPPDSWYSSGIWSEKNPYGIDEQLVFSFPCKTTENGEIQIVSGLKLDTFLQEGLKVTEKELKEERCQISCLK
jgi:malate dehydrogenase